MTKTMDLPLFRTLLQNLLTTNVTLIEQPGDLLDFQERCCLYPTLTPLLTAEHLLRVSKGMEQGTMFEVADELDICVFLFRFADHLFLIGPYVSSAFDEKQTQRLLIDHQFPASFSVSVKLYHTRMTLLEAHQIQHIVLSCIHAFSNTYLDYSFQRLSGHIPEPAGGRMPENELDYETIYQRYKYESRFLSMIEHGKVAGVSQAFRDMCATSVSDYNLSPVAYQSPLTVVRILARKAAERSGLSVVKIDEITQRSVQRMSTEMELPAQLKIIEEMLIELTEAVQAHLSSTEGYSPQIVRLTEYLSLHYSQNLSIDSLCEVAGYSASQLSKVFKAETGKTITEYIARLRCDRAKELLTTTDLPIADISNYVGYLDNNYFVKVFKKQFAATPTEYRKKNTKRAYLP